MSQLDGALGHDRGVRAEVMSPAVRRIVRDELAAADRFIDAARVVCDEAKGLGVDHCVVFLHAETAPPVLAIDNVPVGLDATNRAFNVGKDGAWQRTPMFLQLRERVEFLRPDEIPVFAAPGIGPDGWFLTIMFGTSSPLTCRLELQLALLTSRLTAWCVAHGFQRVLELPESSGLSKRQFGIAQLAVTGSTNVDIARLLGISINTVKVRLKQVFQRLGVTSRDELALLMRQLAPLAGVPLGVSQHGSVWVTRDRELSAWVP